MSSKRHLRRKSCTGKKQYPSQQEAEHAAYNYGVRRGQGWLTPYRCQFCNHWHIGHPPARVRQSIIARRGAQ